MKTVSNYAKITDTDTKETPGRIGWVWWANMVILKQIYELLFITWCTLASTANMMAVPP